MPTINLGRVGFVNKGAYVDATGLAPHKVNDIVQQGTTTYACIQYHDTAHPPTETAYWQKWTDYGIRSVTDVSSTVVASSDSRYVNYFLGTAGLSTGVMSIRLASLVTETASNICNEYFEITITQDDQDLTLGTNPPSYKFMIKGDMKNGVWYNAQAVLMGTSTVTPINVRFTRDATNAYIEIGETSSNWYYPVVEIAHLINTNSIAYTPVFLASINGALLGTTTDFIIATSQVDIANITHSATGKTTPVDADEINICDSASSFSLKKLTWANLKATLKTYFDTLYLSITSISPDVRQTVLSGTVDTSGFSAFGGATGATTVTTATTLIATCADGVNDRVGTIVNPSWTGLSTNGTMYLYLDIATDGTCTTGSTTLAPTYRWGGADVVTNNQFTYNIQEGKGKVGNGATATQVYRTFCGEVTVAGGVVTAITWYALMGRYCSSRFSISANTDYSKNHNIGTDLVNVKCYGAATAGAYLREFSYYYSSPNYYGAYIDKLDKTNLNFRTSQAAQIYSGSTTIAATEAIIMVERGW